MTGKPIPPLYIYSSKAKEGSEQFQFEWIETHAYIGGKWDHKNYQSFTPWVAARRQGSMDNKLFMEYITKVIFELFPEETVSLEVVRDEHGRLVKGSVLWMMDIASNRIIAIVVSTPEWDKWAKEMSYCGVLIFLLIPNSTTVTTMMDDLFRAFRGKCRQTSPLDFALKLQASSEVVAKLKTEHTRLSRTPRGRRRRIRKRSC